MNQAFKSSHELSTKQLLKGSHLGEYGRNSVVHSSAWPCRDTGGRSKYSKKQERLKFGLSAKCLDP